MRRVLIIKRLRNEIYNESGALETAVGFEKLVTLRGSHVRHPDNDRRSAGDARRKRQSQIEWNEATRGGSTYSIASGTAWETAHLRFIAGLVSWTTMIRVLSMWREKNMLAGCWEATMVTLDRCWLPLSENPDHHPQKNEPFSQEMHLKIPLLSRGLKVSNSNPGCRVSALHFFVK